MMSWNGATLKSVRNPIASMFFFHSVCTSRIDAAGAQRQHEREARAVGRAAKAVGVALVVAEAIEQRLRGGGIVQRFHRQLRIVAADAGRNHLVRRNRLVREHDLDQRVGVPAVGDRAPQRDPLVAHAADHRILHVEVEREQEGLDDDRGA